MRSKINTKWAKNAAVPKNSLLDFFHFHVKIHKNIKNVEILMIFG
jgi:hypothetical protein